MDLRSSDIPQADRIWDVARVPEAIAAGHKTPETIGAYLGAKVPRQGHYYIQAARVLGLVETERQDGDYQLTGYGRAFAHYDRNAQFQALRRLMREHEPTRAVLAALRTHAMTQDDIAKVLMGLAPLSQTTARRRARTIATWITSVHLALWRDGQLRHRETPPPPGGYFRS